MDYMKGEIFNKIGLVFKDGEEDTNPYGHPVVVLNDSFRDGKIYFLKVISDVTRMVQYPGRYKLIKNTRKNGLERPSLICVDEVYCIGDANEPVRGEITLQQYTELLDQICKYNAENLNSDEVYIEWRELIGDLGSYKQRVTHVW